MPILVLFGLISIMVIYFYFDNGNLMQYLIVAYSAAVILKLFVEINEVSYLKKIINLNKIITVLIIHREILLILIIAKQILLILILFKQI